ncbi:MAG: hypothetical protein WCP65_01210 [Bacteroidota bacterium]
MKKIILILTFILIKSISVQAQHCTIKCQEYNPSNKSKQKGVPFSLIFKVGKKEVSLASNQDGVLTIEKSVFDKMKSSIIHSFMFLNPADHEYYGTPYQLYNKKKRLSDICGLTLTVDRIW